jgi:propionyl-CoA synthetase
MSYRDEYQASVTDPEGFWRRQAAELSWFEPPGQALVQDADGSQRWFSGGKLNTSFLALDAHIEAGRGDTLALIYDSPVTATKVRYSYRQLRDEVARCAGAMRALGVTHGDRVVIYLPMIPQAVISMLACARLGAVHSVVFGGFAPHELAVRIDDATPKLVITASCGIEVGRVLAYKPMVDEAIDMARHKPEHVVVLRRPQQDCQLQPGRDLDWETLLATAAPAAPVPVDATDPLYILYTSGTTGKPKGVVRDNGGHAVALNYSMRAIYGMEPGEVFWAASDVGWVVGHSYIVYAPLIRGCTTVLYEGKPVKTPDAGAFWRVIAEHNVKVFFTAPTAFRAVKKEDPQALLKEAYDLSALEAVFVAGERLDPPTYEWLTKILPVPVIDHWWQTETGWPIVANPRGLDLFAPKSGSSGRPVPGFEVQVLDEEGHPLPPNRSGNIAIKLPLPPGCLPTLWQDRERFERSYLSHYPGYYASGDGGYIDEDGYVFIMGRVDDVINVAGHRLSTGAMEEVLGAHAAVAECAVVGVEDELRGQLPVGFVVLKDGVSTSEDALEAELVECVRRQIGAVACLRQVAVVQKLPKTRSGKILRKTMRALSQPGEVAVPSTIDDPSSLEEIREALRRRGVGQYATG